MRFSRRKTPDRAQSLTAAAQVVTGRQLRTLIGQFSWQKAAWDFYDSCSELHYAINYMARAASRARLFVGLPDPDGASEPSPTDDAQAKALLDELGDDFTAHGELIRKMAIHLQVAGESFVIGMDDPDTGDRKWIAASSEELRMAGDNVFLRTSPNTQVELSEADTLILRVYYQNPRFSWQPESNVRALLSDLARLQGLSSHILATTDSRLAGAGVLFIGDSVSVPAGSPGDEAQHEDPFVDGLLKAMITPITDRNSASAVVPYVVRVPDESLDKIKHVTFWSQFDEQVPALIDLTLKKVAVGLDMPAEILLGMGDVNHWGQWALQEDVVKTSIAPLLATICQAFTCKYLRPGYQNLTGAECQSVIWFDTTELTARPNKGKEALDLHDKGLVSDECARRENGFGDEDAPSHEERLKTLLWELATTPAGAALVLPILVPGITPPAAASPPAIEQGPGQDAAPSAEPGGERAIPAQPDRANPPADTPANPPGQGG